MIVGNLFHARRKGSVFDDIVDTFTHARTEASVLNPGGTGERGATAPSP